MATGSGEEDTMIHGEGRDAERKAEREDRKKGIGIREKIGRGKGRGISERLPG